MVLDEKALLKPLRWKKPRRVFVTSVSDPFHPAVTDEMLDRLFAVMAEADWHTYQLLTKRPERMREYCTTFVKRHSNEDAPGILDRTAWPLPNLWLGVSVEDQAAADERIPHLLKTPAAVRFLSGEPLLGPVDVERWLNIVWQCCGCKGYFTGRHRKICPDCGREGYWTGSHAFNGRGRKPHPVVPPQSGRGIDWVIVGGESSLKARPMHPDWVRGLRDQCDAACVPFFFKQWGEWLGGEWEDTGDHGRFIPASDSDQVLLYRGGTAREHWFDEEQWPDGPGAYRVGKKAAGHFLDGREHLDIPEGR